MSLPLRAAPGADRRGFWHFEPDGRTEDALRRKYQGFPADFPTLACFAEYLFTGGQWALT